MKLRGLTKLALSGVALAAVAATLGTSTYAWYVSNTTATVSGAQGSTAGAETTGSLYAASESMHASGQWSNKIALASGTDYTAATQLVPVTKVTSTQQVHLVLHKHQLGQLLLANLLTRLAQMYQRLKELI